MAGWCWKHCCLCCWGSAGRNNLTSAKLHLLAHRQECRKGVADVVERSSVPFRHSPSQDRAPTVPLLQQSCTLKGPGLMNSWKIPARSIRYYLADSVSCLPGSRNTEFCGFIVKNRTGTCWGKRNFQWKGVSIHSIKAWISASPSIEVTELMWMWLASAMHLW